MIYREKEIHQRMLLMITHADDEHKLEKTLRDLHIPIYYQCYGKGTATSEILDMWGLSGTKRLVTVCLMSKLISYKILFKINQIMAFQKKGKGVAVTIPVTGMQDGIRHLLDHQNIYTESDIKEGETIMKEKIEYSVILTAVNHGYSENVIHAAKGAGAKGGTLLKGRRFGSDEVVRFLRITMLDEQEMVLIIVPQNKKSAVMSAISHECGMKTPARGIVIALPVEEVAGLEELTE